MARNTIYLLINRLEYVSEELNSTLLSQLTGKIIEVSDDNNINEALVYIFNEFDKMLCSGVLTSRGSVITNIDCLGDDLNSFIQIQFQFHKRPVDFRIDHKFITEMRVSIYNR